MNANANPPPPPEPKKPLVIVPTPVKVGEARGHLAGRAKWFQRQTGETARPPKAKE